MSSIANPISSQPVGTTSTGSASGSSSTSSAPNNQLTGSSFIQLLTAQLQAQDPLNPIDPTAFVSQLVQFNQLQQLIDINQTLSQPAVASPASGTQSSSSQTSAVQPNSGSASAAIL
jgi:flagellar basal-body rod modification protein FlgD